MFTSKIVSSKSFEKFTFISFEVVFPIFFEVNVPRIDLGKNVSLVFEICDLERVYQEETFSIIKHT